MFFGKIAATITLTSLFIVPTAFAAESAGGVFLNADGKEVGEVRLLPLAAGGVNLIAEVSGLPPGSHGFHIHETGTCDASVWFESAGGHYDPARAEHGWNAANGPHAGDLPNVHVGPTGDLAVEFFVTTVSLDEGDAATLLDEDGSAVIIHLDPDDYASQPSGSAGDRIACAEIGPR